MRDPSIIPSAQRLAEANNVNWRTLQGSGDGGSVVERDVLAHLARVMLGEAETNPTPEPLPEGMRAWPEEAERLREAEEDAARDAFAAPFTAPESSAEPEAEARSPWTLEQPAEPTRTVGWDDDADADVAEAEVAEPKAAESEAADDEFVAEPVEAEADSAEEHPAEDQIDAPVSAERSGVAEEGYQAALDELELLKARVETLQEERSRHLGELEQLSGLRETIEAQNAEVAKVGPLQREVAELRDQLAGAQTEAQRVQELTAHNQDLEERLVRAREFKEGAKAELGRIMATNAALEAQLAPATKPKRPWWRFGR